MKKNIGKADRSIRIMLAVAAVALILTDVLAGTWAWVAGIATFAFLATSFFNWCPFYVPFKFSTVSKSSD
jgi:O-antigen/teichoic acid export membrane protein